MATAGFSLAMMGINILLLSALALGVLALRQRFVPRAVAWLLIAVAPGGILVTLTLFPTTPSGALSVFSVVMIGVGVSLATGQNPPQPAH